MLALGIVLDFEVFVSNAGFAFEALRTRIGRFIERFVVLSAEIINHGWFYVCSIGPTAENAAAVMPRISFFMGQVLPRVP